jgi:hypothetical protein
MNGPTTLVATWPWAGWHVTGSKDLATKQTTEPNE